MLGTGATRPDVRKAFGVRTGRGSSPSPAAHPRTRAIEVVPRTVQRSDVYRDFAPFYDLYVGGFAADLPVYLKYARRARTPLVEVGAGAGRLTIPLARAGHAVVAVDVSRAMLARLTTRLRRREPGGPEPASAP